MNPRSTPRYLVLVLRTPAFDAAQADADGHFLEELRARGQLELQGPFGDRSGGACLMRADSLAQAQRIAARDPLVVSGSLRAQVYEWAAT